MKRGTKALLGIAVALTTAAILHLTVGERFRDHGLRYGSKGGCGYHWNELDGYFHKKPANPVPNDIH